MLAIVCRSMIAIVFTIMGHESNPYKKKTWQPDKKDQEKTEYLSRRVRFSRRVTQNIHWEY